MSDTKEAKITDPSAALLGLQVKNNFLLPFEIEEILQEFSNLIQLLPNDFLTQATTFNESMLAVHATATFPYRFAQSKASALHFQRIRLAERIRSLPVYESEYAIPEEERNKKAEILAQEKFTAFVQSEEGLNHIVSDLSLTLLEALKEPSTAKGADELILQAVVGLWSAFEVFVRDELVVLLNTYPALAIKLLNDPGSKKYFELPKLSIEELSSSEYNLSKTMGSLIIGTRDFSDLRIIKAAFGAITNNQVLIEVLNTDKLWHLNQSRHLIIHRRGIVDAKYKASTNCSLNVGEKISVPPSLLYRYFIVVVNSAVAFLKGVLESRPQ